MTVRFVRRCAACALAVLLHAGCAPTPVRPAELTDEHTLADPALTAWGREFANAPEARRGLSGLHFVSVGVDGLATRVQIIRRAEQSLDLQYFIFRGGDASGALIIGELRRAADRGVKVRVLVDDGDTAAGDEQLLRLDGYRGMQVRVFNPFGYRGHNRLLRNLDFALHHARLDYRMHNKLLVADGAVALIGGRNVGDQYFQIDPVSQFADDDVFTVGAAVKSMSAAYDEFWNSEFAVPASRLGHLPKTRSGPRTGVAGGDWQARVESGEPLASLVGSASSLTWSGAKVIYDSPAKRDVEHRRRPGRLMSEPVETRIAGTHTDLVIASPYFVPSERELQLLQEASARGAKVRVLTNSLESTQETAAHSGYQKDRRALLSAGIRLFEVRARLDSTRGSGQGRAISRFGNYALHGKMYVFDGQAALLGSWNFDQRSLRINTEIGLLMESPAIAGQIESRFDAMVAPTAAYEVLAGPGQRLGWRTQIDGRLTTLDEEPSRGWWKRIKAGFLGLLPLQPEL